MKTFCEVKLDFCSSCYSQKQSGGLVSWGSQVLKDSSLHYTLKSKLKNRQKKRRLKTLYCTKLLWPLPGASQNIFRRASKDQEVEKQFKSPLSELKNMWSEIWMDLKLDVNHMTLCELWDQKALHMRTSVQDHMLSRVLL